MKKKLVSLLTAVLATLPLIALAGGGSVDSGCGSEPLPKGCEHAFWWVVVIILGLFALVAIYDTYKMKTDPEYRARAEEIRRESDARYRR